MFRADVAWRTDRYELGAGRFFAPSALWLSMDGVRGTLNVQRSWATVFAGRRAISLSRRNLPPSAFLPVLGADVGVAQAGWRGQIAANLAGDRIVLGNPGDEVQQDVLGGSALARVTVTASEVVQGGAQASVANNATFAVGPNAGELTLTLQALSLYQALGWARWRPSRGAQVSGTVLHQQVTVVSEDSVDLPLVDPSFTDLRVRGVFGNMQLGFLRPDVRLRFRNARTELRYGGAFELHVPTLRGPYVLGVGWLEHVFDVEEPALVDRLRWQLGAGWERGAVQAEAGLGVIDRAAGPVSGRPADPNREGIPGVSEDLSPFVLEAQNVAFLRGFVTGRRWFAGADLEANLLDRELRAFIQVGLIGRTSW